MAKAESGLVVLVPRAEPLVRSFRERYDPQAALGVPAHITVLYPFKPPDEIDERVMDKLRRCFSGFAPTDFSLAATHRFPDQALFLAPEPEEPFRRLTEAVWGRFPETPPYGGKYPAIVPHLTVAQLPDARQFDAVAAEFAQASDGRLPIRARATQVTLMVNKTGRWEVGAAIGLG